jgi:hypothetical protein
MHKTFFLSKEVSGVYEFFYHFSNNHLFHDPLFFHEKFLLPLVLSLIPSSFASATDLSCASLEHLSEFSLSSVCHCLLCSSALLFSSFLQFLLMFFLSSALVSIRLCLCITNSGILAFGLLIMVGGFPTFFHLFNTHSELTCLMS